MQLLGIVFFTTYQTSLNKLIRQGSAAHAALLQGRFASEAERPLLALQTEIAAALRANDQVALDQLAEQLLERPTTQRVVVFDSTGLRASAGKLERADSLTSVPAPGQYWQPEHLSVVQAIEDQGEPLGMLQAVYALDELNAEIAAFDRQVTATETGYRRDSLIRGALAAALVILMGLLVAWISARRLVMSLKSLSRSAERLGRGDFGEQIEIGRVDELGELAEAFFHMRDKLKQTTISRDYLDKVLRSMNEAITVTQANGSIIRINDATTKLLGYTEEELLGQPVLSIVAAGHRDSFRADGPVEVAKETVYKSKDGREIPVSYTGSRIDTDDPHFQGSIFAAQNINDRKRAEQRIRFLARMDSLTKVPNRMQFQHLLQRGIARARKNRQQLVMMYIDIDRFKDINDTFGHQAGDTSLETVTERVIKTLPPNNVVGRLAGDEFAVLLDGFDDDQALKRHIAEIAQQVLRARDLYHYQYRHRRLPRRR